MTNMSQFLHNDDDNDEDKAIAIPRVFSENSRAKTTEKSLFPLMLEHGSLRCTHMTNKPCFICLVHS